MAHHGTTDPAQRAWDVVEREARELVVDARNYLKQLPPHVAERKGALLLKALVAENERLRGLLTALPDPQPIEPSDSERAKWPDMTETYVGSLEGMYGEVMRIAAEAAGET